MIKQIQKLSVSLILLTSCTLLQGCYSLSAEKEGTSKVLYEEDAVMAMPMTADAAPLAKSKSRMVANHAVKLESASERIDSGSGSAAEAEVQERRVILDYNYLISVKNIKQSCMEIENYVKELDGYLLTMSPEMVVVRIPSSECDLFRHRLNDLGRIVREESTGRDVTAEMVDIELRLGNLKSLRERLIELSKQSGRVEELLKVEVELGRVTGEIEQLEGMLKFYNERTDYATFTLHLQEEYRDPQQDVQVLAIPFLSFYGYNPSGYQYGNGRDDAPFKITLPENMLVVNSGKNGKIEFMEAVADDHSGIRISKFHNLPGGTQQFWNELFAKTFKDTFKYTDCNFETLEIGEGRIAGELTAVDGKYALYIVTDYDDWSTWGDGCVYCIEVQNEGAISDDIIEDMLLSIDLSIWR